MPDPAELLTDLETRFWQALVDQDADAAADLLAEPAVLVGAHGSLRFDRAAYRRMAAEGPLVLRAYELRDMQVNFPGDDVAIVTYGVTQTVGPRGPGQGKVQHLQDSSVWLREGDEWQCALHTETPVEPPAG